MRGLAAVARLLTALSLAVLLLAGGASRWSTERAVGQVTSLSLPAALRLLAVALAAAAALGALLGFARPGGPASASREARLGFAARIAAAVAALLPLLWAVLSAGRQAGSAAAAGAQALGLLGMVLLSAYLCLHLRASLLQARFWASATVCALACVSFLRSWGFELGAINALAVAADVAAAGALVTLSGSLPGKRPAAEIPIAELASLSLFGSVWAFGSPGPVALFAAGAALVAAGVRKAPRSAPLVQAACLAAGIAVLLDGDTGAAAIPLLAGALAVGR